MQATERPNVTLVLGGARSGKSRFAQASAERRFHAPLFVATADAFDDEMKARIARHRQARGNQWLCTEQPLEVPAAISRPPAAADGILVDCLTIWATNVLLREGADGVKRRSAELVAALLSTPLPVILVSNEVGMGIVPEHPLGREFRDLAGWLNQDVATVSDNVVLIVAGLPMYLKGHCRASRAQGSGGML
jgi:adenosylcobinamide kinase/adenosylcobinamide-phosphate guanylyltransferase